MYLYVCVSIYIYVYIFCWIFCSMLIRLYHANLDLKLPNFESPFLAPGAAHHADAAKKADCFAAPWPGPGRCPCSFCISSATFWASNSWIGSSTCCSAPSSKRRPFHPVEAPRRGEHQPEALLARYEESKVKILAAWAPTGANKQGP